MQKFSTPMMRQYQAIKEKHADCLLFFRLGDFYELFLDDAKLGAKILDITLTKRPRGKDGEIPMAGVPYHSADSYIAKLVKTGHKVAICEQVSEPDSKGIVEREVVRIITPGTILDEKSLNQKEYNYTMSLSIRKNRLGLAIADVSTGDFQVTEMFLEETPQNNDLTTAQLENGTPKPKSSQPDFRPFTCLITEIARLRPAECIVNENLYNQTEFLKALKAQENLNINCFREALEFENEAETFLNQHFKTKTLNGFGLGDKPEAVKAAASLLGYLSYTQKGRINHIKSLKTYAPDNHVILDRSTMFNLELFWGLQDQEQSRSLISVIDHTVTAGGGRLLKNWLRKPLTNQDRINQRLDAVHELLKKRLLREEMKDSLKQINDMPRILSRLSVGLGNALDLVALKNSLIQALNLHFSLKQAQSPLLQRLRESISLENKKIIAFIDKIIQDNPPIDLKNGGLIKPGINKKLDQLRQKVGGSKEWILELEKKERERTGIASLKVRFNKVFGYYIEISKANQHLVPKDYLRKQTMVNAERFITPQLKEEETKILSAEETIKKLELELFEQTTNRVLEKTEMLQKTAHTLATIDCLNSLAQLAEQENYTRPQITSEDTIEIQEGRHPVVEKCLSDQFVPNDILLNSREQQLLVITGPNMAGKSVFMRQVALITLLAHMGSFVPAQKAKISLVDRIFVRSGASDSIATGLSTFMLEMVETAHILNNATAKSLIIMDEIGRGTSTYDGISIAYAVAEYLVKNPKLRPKTLFATHYHELQSLEDRYPGQVKNYNVAVEETSQEDPVFLHKVIPGRASHSYAVVVAKLAGVPQSVTKRASRILEKMEQTALENGERNKTWNGAETSESKRKTAKKSTVPTQTNPLDAKMKKSLTNLDIQNLTPLEALNLLAKWRKSLLKGRSSRPK